MKEYNTPVAFLIFNRPEYTKKVFNEIRKIQPRKLFIIADGPRTPSERKLCEEARMVVDNIDWPCEVYKNYANKNLGLKDRFQSGLNWFFSHVEQGIILEDDCIPHQSFFSFVEEMLEKYKNNQRIMMVSGSNSISTYTHTTNYFFSGYASIWGWATWRRAWKMNDSLMREWSEKSIKRFIKGLDPIVRKYLLDFIKNVYSGNTKTWDEQWFLTFIVHNGLAIVPSKNLISNIGVYGIHSNGEISKNQKLPIHNLYDKPLPPPLTIEKDTIFDSLLYQKNFNTKPFKFQRYIKQKMITFLIKKSIVKTIYHIIVQIYITFRGQGIFDNVNETNHQKNCLLMYIVEPFKKKGDYLGHQNYWQAKELARIIGEFKYNVDVIKFDDKHVKFNKKYDMVIDLHPGINLKYESYLSKNARKIAYITGSNISFSNQAEKERIESINNRRGVKLEPRRQASTFNAKLLSSFDAMFFIGNTYNLKTYVGYTPKNVSLIRNTGYNFLAEHDHSNRSSKKFLFLAGGGMVHKGLDLLLEVFIKNPSLDLYICCNLDSEKDFKKLYFNELYATKNIHPIGFIDIDSFKFINLIKEITYIIAPSCSEGISGSVLTGMSAGLIPIISRECGLDDNEANILENCLPETIEREILKYSIKPKEWRIEKAELAIQIIKERYSDKNFSESIRKALSNVLIDKTK